MTFENFLNAINRSLETGEMPKDPLARKTVIALALLSHSLRTGKNHDQAFQYASANEGLVEDLAELTLTGQFPNDPARCLVAVDFVQSIT